MLPSSGSLENWFSGIFADTLFKDLGIDLSKRKAISEF